MESLKLDGMLHDKNIESTPEYMRKLFIMPDSSDRFVEFGVHLLDMIHDFFKEKGGIHSSISMEDLANIFCNIEMPSHPQLIKDVLNEIKNNIIKHSVKVANPYYIGHMTSAVPYFMILLEMIAVSLNQNQVKIESAKASTFVEREFLCWIHHLIYDNIPEFYRKHIQNPKIALGNITSDGTMANLTALTLAMAKAFPPDTRGFRGVRVEGLARALDHYGYRQALFLVSRRGHYSICKAGTILGIGEHGVVHVPVQPCLNTIDISKLLCIIDKIRKEDKAAGLPTKFVALVGIAGTTETGNIDDLDSLAEIARDLGAHFHVDAAWGGGALLMEGARPMMKGIEKADSVTMDAHKLLYAPNSMGICVFRNGDDSRHLYHTSNYIIREGSVDQGRFTIEGSRSFSCLKPWAAIKIIGRHGYRLIFDHARDLQNTFVEFIERDPLFELMNKPELFIINYRFVPEELRSQLKNLMKNPKKNSDRITLINKIINTINIELHKTIRDHDTSFVSRTRLESTPYAPRKIVVLRAITINPNTERYMLKQVLNEHRSMGIRIWNDMKKTSGDSREVLGSS
ncbi:MAG TPA: pyridoxal-dependent decarboxylase [Deltaproteobacteria bacterium]|nr:glutamate decarboxylase [Deltaproteobacteria bacterium]OQC27800.1 MAG: L-2,4-diaminobutyrate decarboxylase [Deltaproteobacteria bacterium ADurb.Bin072]HRW79232.1 pyridoxal-dependent decarboxylase [Desulfomonilia bacterium]HNQ85112.1 pyridoxal-dependent decarboxylase [Deltaproteobacteria bacterium]HNS89412.1 pyridoxal-dependent decarboxylase [Deltaproteobacteria bacterium]